MSKTMPQCPKDALAAALKDAVDGRPTVVMRCKSSMAHVQRVDFSQALTTALCIVVSKLTAWFNRSIAKDQLKDVSQRSFPSANARRHGPGMTCVASARGKGDSRRKNRPWSRSDARDHSSRKVDMILLVDCAD